MYICLCKSVTDHQIRDAVKHGATRMCDLRRELGVATGCGCCAEAAQRELDAALAALPEPQFDAAVQAA
jgi:bacterioferritin-associated ferredoxin